MNKPSYSASSANCRLVIGSTSTESFSAMRAMCLIEAAEDGAIFSLGSNSTARSYLAMVRALGPRDPTQIRKPLRDPGDASLSLRIAFAEPHQHADPPHAVGLLCARAVRRVCTIVKTTSWRQRR